MKSLVQHLPSSMMGHEECHIQPIFQTPRYQHLFHRVHLKSSLFLPHIHPVTNRHFPPVSLLYSLHNTITQSSLALPLICCECHLCTGDGPTSR